MSDPLGHPSVSSSSSSTTTSSEAKGSEIEVGVKRERNAFDILDGSGSPPPPKQRKRSTSRSTGKGVFKEEAEMERKAADRVLRKHLEQWAADLRNPPPPGAKQVLKHFMEFECLVSLSGSGSNCYHKCVICGSVRSANAANFYKHVKSADHLDALSAHCVAFSPRMERSIDSNDGLIALCAFAARRGISMSAMHSLITDPLAQQALTAVMRHPPSRASMYRARKETSALILEKSKSLVKDQPVTLIIDETSTQDQLGLTTAVACTPRGLHLIHAQIEEDSIDSESFKKFLADSMTEAEIEESNLVAVMGDGASYITKALREKGILRMRCIAHVLQRVIAAFMEHLPCTPVVENICTEINNANRAVKQRLEEQGVRVSVFNTPRTRWGQWLDVLEEITMHISAIETVVEMKSPVSAAAACSFQFARERLLPLVLAIRKAEGDAAPAAEVLNSLRGAVLAVCEVTDDFLWKWFNEPKTETKEVVDRQSMMLKSQGIDANVELNMTDKVVRANLGRTATSDEVAAHKKAVSAVLQNAITRIRRESFMRMRGLRDTIHLLRLRAAVESTTYKVARHRPFALDPTRVTSTNFNKLLPRTWPQLTPADVACLRDNLYELKDSNVSDREFWADKVKEGDAVAKIAWRALCIPASSAAAERRFSQMKRAASSSRQSPRTPSFLRDTLILAGSSQASVEAMSASMGFKITSKEEEMG